MIYVKPPRGDILLNELYECVTTRINYFLYHYEQDSAICKDGIKFQYLTLGTALDRTGHFMLRLLSAQSEPLREFVVSSEATFIIERLEFLTSKQILQLITTTLRHLNECGNNITHWTSEIKYIFTEMRNVFKSSHMMDFKHDENCTVQNLKDEVCNKICTEFKDNVSYCGYYAHSFKNILINYYAKKRFLKNFVMSRQLAFLLISQAMKKKCCKSFFKMCLNLVAKREFAMEKGKVIIPCGKWKIFLKHLFIAHMKQEIFKIQTSESALEPMSDHRLLELKNTVLSQFGRKTIGPGGINIVATELDGSKGLFPPCMRYLYNNLKTTHRLSHSARFNFSLFLKDIGMSLNESIAFWKAEYSKPSKCVEKCSHCWQVSSRKYVYSIRHLYGLEGRRANYCAPSCSKIQGNNLGPVEEGGCPFLNLDLGRIKNLLDQNVVQNNKEFGKIVQLSLQGQALAACDCYRKAVMNVAGNELCSDSMQHNTPVEFFLILQKYLHQDIR